jgi:hypothetical protein
LIGSCSGDWSDLKFCLPMMTKTISVLFGVREIEQLSSQAQPEQLPQPQKISFKNVVKFHGAYFQNSKS